MLIREQKILDPKSKRLQFDVENVKSIIERNPEQFNLACIIYYLHGSKTKQWAYSTNNLDVIKLLRKSIQRLNKHTVNSHEITYHCSYPLLSVQSFANTTDKKQVQSWVKQRWGEFLPNHKPDRFTFNPRKNANQKQLQSNDTPGSLEIRLGKSMGAMLAFRARGKHLIQEANGGNKL